MQWLWTVCRNDFVLIPWFETYKGSMKGLHFGNQFLSLTCQKLGPPTKQDWNKTIQRVPANISKLCDRIGTKFLSISADTILNSSYANEVDGPYGHPNQTNSNHSRTALIDSRYAAPASPQPSSGIPSEQHAEPPTLRSFATPPSKTNPRILQRRWRAQLLPSKSIGRDPCP